MIVIPAIDLKDGECVRLVQGRADELSVVADDPVETALRWQSAGASLLHVIDLDGAFEGKPRNLPVVAEIVRALSIPVQMGGGMRSLEGLRAVLDVGVQRVILGTVAVEQPSLVRQAVQEFGERVVVGIDAQEGQVAVRGWVEGTELNAVELAERVRDDGIVEIIFTDISRDGTLWGPNLESLARMTGVPGLSVIAAGGVASLADLLAIKAIPGVKGAIVGKALYSGHVDLSEAIQEIEGDIGMDVHVDSLKWDAHGLIPAIVQDATSGQVLMLAYMNREALQRSLQSKETWFYSRSRDRLWHKGEQSGHVQEIEQIHTDCDQDTLLVRVRQKGAGACHEGFVSCFHYAVELVGQAVQIRLDDTSTPSFDPKVVYTEQPPPDEHSSTERAGR